MKKSVTVHNYCCLSKGGKLMKRFPIKKVFYLITAGMLLQLAVISTSYAAPLLGGQPGSGSPGGGGNCGSTHTVQYGETLFSIGRAYGITVQDIIAANGLYNPDHIYAGQALYIPCNSGHQPHPGGEQYPSYGYQFPSVGYGYDFTGYYYETYHPGYRRYSYTCGYHFNCY